MPMARSRAKVGALADLPTMAALLVAVSGASAAPAVATPGGQDAVNAPIAAADWQVPGEADPEALARHLTLRADSQLSRLSWPKSPAEVQAFGRRVRRELRRALALPGPTGTPPAVEMVGKIELDTCTVERLALSTAPGLYAPCNLYVPRGLTRRAPAVLFLFGHGNRLADLLSVALDFVRQGFVTMTIEPWGGGETGVAWPWSDYHGGMPAAALLAAGRPLSGLVVYNHIRALDYLESRSEVDPRRLGVTGMSGGGTHSLWLAAADERVAAVAPASCAWVSRSD